MPRNRAREVPARHPGPRKVAVLPDSLMRLMLTRPLNSLMRPDIAAVLLDAGLDLAP